MQVKGRDAIPNAVVLLYDGIMGSIAPTPFPSVSAGGMTQGRKWQRLDAWLVVGRYDRIQ